MALSHRPAVLVILDGWGFREDAEHNAIAKARTPVWDGLWQDCPHTLIDASGAEVGLPTGQMGNSEVGHLNLGAGRVVYQEFTRISRAIASGRFFKNKVLVKAVERAADKGKAVHILGLLSPGGVHSHEDHILAMIEMAALRGADRIYLHAFLDGRDTPPRSAAASIQRANECFEKVGKGRFASVIGRYYAMDRDHRWPRIKSAWDLIAHGEAEFTASSADEALDMAYARDESDEFVKATAILGKDGKAVTIEDGDSVIFMNFRSDRARQITRPFIEPDFDGFDRGRIPRLTRFTSLTEYNSQFEVFVAFPPERLSNTFGEYIANAGLRQLRIAETEKYAHVTFFFNGGVEDPYEGEERILVPSPNVATYDLQPRMSGDTVTEKLVEAIESGRFDAIICNFANPDMVGHTGNFDATVAAIEAVDGFLDRIVKSLRKVGGEMLITADHGNAEMMQNNETGQAHTAHTSYLVPLIYVGRRARLTDGGSLADVTPSMLALMGMEKPGEMSGESLVVFEPDELADTGS